MSRKILFFCNANVSQPACGGIVRVTGTLAELFQKQGDDTYLVYYDEIDDAQPSAHFLARYRLTRHQEEDALKPILQKHQIDYLILQVPLANTTFYLLPLLRQVIDSACPQCQLIHCIHTIPFAETKGFDVEYIRHNLRQKGNAIWMLKQTVWGVTCLLSPHGAKKLMSKRYQYICRYCDTVVLLSQRFIHYFDQYVPNAKSKVVAIPDPATYLPEGVFQSVQKRKEVLFVGRMDESTKRVSKLLKIWKIIEKEYHIDDWKLILVGDGSDKTDYQRYATKHALNQVSFCGKQDPTPYLQSASIIALTSAYEGLSMVLVEGLQHGCIPIAFNTFDSVLDTITDGRNGAVIPNNDYKAFAAQLALWMKQPDSLSSLRAQTSSNLKKFDPAAVCQEWNRKVFKK